MMTQQDETKIRDRLKQWIDETTNPNHPDYVHADLDYPAERYAPIQQLVKKLRDEAGQFSADDARRLFGLLDAGGRMKNKIVDGNELPELRRELLTLLDGDGRPSERIAAAAQRVRYAGESILGELYGWVHAEEAPKYNGCATDALTHLGYQFDPNNYDQFVEAHTQLAKLYREEVGRLRDDIPLNLEIDKFYNVVDKVDLRYDNDGRTKNSESLQETKETTRYWRITLPDDWRRRNSRGKWQHIDIWSPSVEHSIAAIDFDGDLETLQVKNFIGIQPGDKVVAFLQKKRIGGVGEVTSGFDRELFDNRPTSADYFDGLCWIRIDVRWQPTLIQVDELPKETANMFLGQTIMELSAAQYQDVVEAMRKKLVVQSTIAKQFKGFSAETFRFLDDLEQNNNLEWMKANRTRYHAHVRDPMKALVSDVGKALKPLLDPFLAPDELEIEPKSNKTISNIRRSWPTESAEYHPYYWAAFYRVGRKKQTDAQLFVNLHTSVARIGVYFGSGADDIKRQLRQRVQNRPDYVWQLIERLGLHEQFEFAREHQHVNTDDFKISTKADVVDWVSHGDFDVLHLLTPEQVADAGAGFADVVFDTLRQLFPLFLLAVADDYEARIESYLAKLEIDIDVDDEDEEAPASYSAADFLANTYLEQSITEDLLALLEDKPQLIFYGPPGTGKTFVARHLARLKIGLQNPPQEQLEIVQFHPAYGYEDFIEGIRPKSERLVGGQYIVNYPVQSGVFKKFCRRALQEPDKPFVFIIDEINRGNIPRIFGELMLLLEYRDMNVTLPYSGERFRIPPNVYLIGTMNTADRSIALVDFALRRRFHFVNFPADPALFARWQAANPLPLPYLVELFHQLNEQSVSDANFAIGHSYFMNPKLTEQKLRLIWQRSVMPYLREFYFDEPAKANEWDWNGQRVQGIRERYG